MGRENGLRRDHPVFFWGMLTLVVGFLAATAVVAARAPDYQREAAALNAEMSEQEREVRDRVLESQARRAGLAVALLQREVRVKAMQQKGLHLAISVEDSTLYLRHGAATLRQVPVRIGPDTTVRAPDGRTWRIVRPLGERHIAETETSPAYLVPEWVYVARGEAAPDEGSRRIAGALGRYVIRLNDGSEIYSEPKTGPLAGEPKPGAFMVPEQEFQSFFDAIRRETPVFIY